MHALSAVIHSNQLQPHEELLALLDKYHRSGFQKPFARHSRIAFEKAEALVHECKRPLILDSGCGVGASTVQLAREFPGHFVLGIDKSATRLARHHAYREAAVSNYTLVRADLIDFWRLAAQREWQVERHYLLYPNPWPKKRALKRRFHGHPVFWDLIKLGKYFELRSNWQIYAREFEAAFFHCTGKHGVLDKFTPVWPITPFERKYQRSGHALYRLRISSLSTHDLTLLNTRSIL